MYATRAGSFSSAFLTRLAGSHIKAALYKLQSACYSKEIVEFVPDFTFDSL